jgi:hypothetical protein
MKFGVKASEEVETPRDGDWIHYFPKDGEYRIRFLEEWEDWLSLWEHFSMDKKCSYPCTARQEDDSVDKSKCLGCQSASEKEASASKRYIVNAMIQDGQGAGYVHLWKIPSSLKVDILRHRDKSHSDPKLRTITNRDFTIVRYSSGGKTNYSIDKEDTEPIDLSKYALLDKQVALEAAWNFAWNDEFRKAEMVKREERKTAATKKKESEKAADEPEDSPPEEEPEVPYELQTATERTNGAKPTLTVVKDEPEQVRLSTSQIRKMTAEGLRNLFTQGGYDYPEEIEDNRDELAELLIHNLS